jgi:hypothetical protein
MRVRLWTAATNGHIAHPSDDMNLESDGGRILAGENRRIRNCPTATLSTTRPTWIEPGLRGERPAANRLRHGIAYSTHCYFVPHGGQNFWLHCDALLPLAWIVSGSRTIFLACDVCIIYDNTKLFLYYSIII